MPTDVKALTADKTHQKHGLVQLIRKYSTTCSMERAGGLMFDL